MWAMPTGVVLSVSGFVVGGFNATLGGVALLAGLGLVVVAIAGLLTSVFDSE
jgi:hypothetical protein